MLHSILARHPRISLPSLTNFTSERRERITFEFLTQLILNWLDLPRPAVWRGSFMSGTTRDFLIPLLYLLLSPPQGEGGCQYKVSLIHFILSFLVLVNILWNIYIFNSSTRPGWNVRHLHNFSLIPWSKFDIPRPWRPPPSSLVKLNLNLQPWGWLTTSVTSYTGRKGEQIYYWIWIL